MQRQSLNTPSSTSRPISNIHSQGRTRIHCAAALRILEALLARKTCSCARNFLFREGIAGEKSLSRVSSNLHPQIHAEPSRRNP
jgi:hypothetical protein